MACGFLPTEWLIQGESMKHLIAIRARTCALLLFCLFLAGCSALTTKEEMTSVPTDMSSKEPRELFVFLDGTRNDPQSQTNVWRLYEASKAAGRHAIYIGGVGSEETPLLGAILGFGMEPRILRGYAYLSNLYRAQDKIFIMGFSRGAHQARALAGMIAYAGLITPDADTSQRRLLRDSNRVLELVKKLNDVVFEGEMRSAPNQPPARTMIEAQLGIVTRTAVVQFLGVWDTVPGSFFKKYDGCREESDGRDGDRYKSGSYPLIRNIAHAISLDEKRSRFRPITLCDPVAPEKTNVVERGFSGAHSDVGGGYENSSMHLPSLNWMISQINPHLRSGFKDFSGEPFTKPSHWSMSDAPGNWFSKCEDRHLPGLILHDSASAYRKQSSAQIMVQGKELGTPNPPMCKDFETP